MPEEEIMRGRIRNDFTIGEIVPEKTWLLFHPDVQTLYQYVPPEALEHDVFYNKTLFPRPEFALEFDAAIPGWVIDTEAALAHATAAAVAAIDARTQELIAGGFEYAGARFSMSEAAQRNWIALASGLANAMLPFPLTVSILGETSHVLQSANELKALLAAYLAYQADPSQPLAAGRALKERVTAAATVAEVEAVVDDR